MKIGVDIDGTIKDTHRAAIDIFNRELNQSITPEDATDFYLDEIYGLSQKEGKRMWRKWESEIYRLGLPIPHASPVLNDLVTQGHEVFFITARPNMKHLHEITKKWLKDHGFPYTGDNLRMGSQDKAKVAKELDIDLFFEDAPKHLRNLIDQGVRTVIMDAPYNRDFSEDVTRITSWQQVYALIDEV